MAAGIGECIQGDLLASLRGAKRFFSNVHFSGVQPLD